MNQNFTVRKLARCAVVAALYVVLCMALQPFSYGAVQVRVAEALCLLPVFGAEYIVGVVLGCFLANLLGSTIVDVIFGTLATLLACVVTYKLRNVRFKGLAIVPSLPPVLFNAVIIGIEIAVMFPDPSSSAPLWLACITNGISVGIGELISCTVLGVLLVRRRGCRVLAGAALVLCVLCYAGEWRINRWTYEVPAGTAQQASALNDALAELDGRVLFIPYGVRQRDSQLIETYVARDVYIVEYETLLQSGALADGVLDLTAEAVGPEYPGRAYTDLDAADWVLAADGVPVDTTTLEKADAACPAGYVLYRNLDTQRVRFAVS